MKYIFADYVTVVTISPQKIARDLTRDLAKFCNLHRNLPYLPSPKIALVIYIILNLGGVLYATLILND